MKDVTIFFCLLLRLGMNNNNTMARHIRSELLSGEVTLLLDRFFSDLSQGAIPNFRDSCNFFVK